MTDIALPGSIEPARKGPDLSGAINPITGIIFGGIVAAVLLFVAYSIYSDVDAAGTKVTNYLPFLLLFVALLIALGFEFVNGFHDTANGRGDRHLHARAAGKHRCGLVRRVEPRRGSRLLGRGRFRHHFAASGRADPAGRQPRRLRHGLRPPDRGNHLESRHLVVRAAGVELAHPDRLDHRRRHRQRAVARPRRHVGGRLGEAKEVGEALLLSPMFGFALAAALLLLLKSIVRIPALYAEPKGEQPPPWWIRGILILTCTLVSFFHGSNDGQKGMGLIMLILIGTVPTAYALNRALPESQVQRFITASQAASAVIDQKAAGHNVLGDPRPAVTAYVASHTLNEGTYPSLAVLVRNIAAQVSQYGSLARMPAEAVGNARNDMYLASEAIRFLMKDSASELSPDEVKTLNTYKHSLDQATKFIPNWVKVAVAIALGLGTMVGWKRIVITVGEKIGKTHLTYAQGACAEITAAATIAAADGLGLPVSTLTSCPPASPAPWPQTARPVK